MKSSVIDAILDGPALAPPPGVTPNFKDPDNLAHPELAVLQLIIAVVVVAMRTYTKLGVLRKMQAEDYWLIVALLCFIGFHGIVFMLEAMPMGVHQWDLTVRKALEISRLFHISVAIYALVVIPLKVSLILQIRRIFMPHDRSIRERPTSLWIIDGFLTLNVMFYVALFLFQFLACRPLAHAWNPLVPGTCVADKLVVHIVSASINTASDLIIITMPQPVIWSLTLSEKRKWGLSAVFFLGALACVASAVRLYYAVELYYSTDLTYQAALMGKWAEPELTFGFLAACLPVSPAFIKHLRRTSLGLKIRGLWTSSPLSDAKSAATPYDGSNSRQVRTIGSNGKGKEKGSKITKVVETDIEFEVLTRETKDDMGPAPARSRASSAEIDEEMGIDTRPVRQKASVGPLRD